VIAPVLPSASTSALLIGLLCIGLLPNASGTNSKLNPQAQASVSLPNIVWILIDDMGWRDLGCYWHGQHRTPHIDRMAAEGMKFTQAYANAPNCAPSRASMMTGTLPPRHGIYTVGSSKRGKSKNRKLIPLVNSTVLPDSAITIAEHLRPHGYKSAAVGKWHLGDDPRTQGFDVNVAGDKSGHPKSYFSPYKNRNLEDGPEGENLTDRITTEALAFLEGEPEHPRFLYMTFFAVHTPVQGKEELRERYRAAALEAGATEKEARKAGHYGAMVETVDSNVGRLLERIDELERETIVLLFSDNGGHASFTKMDPLRGSKGMLYEGGIREPLILRAPGRIEAGQVCEVPVTSVDFLPTMLAAAGIPVAQAAVLDGIDLSPLFAGESLPERSLYWYFPAYLEGYTKQHGPWRTTPTCAVRRGNHKLIEYFDDGSFELYDLEADAGESRNLLSTHGEVGEQLKQDMASWMKRVGVPDQFERNPEYEAASER
jgi:arylsulfatase A-like enzyme